MSRPIDPNALTAAEQRALLAKLLKKSRPASAKQAPLSFAQQRLWFLDQLTPNSASYNIPAALRLQGALNIPALQESLNEIARRHEILRTTFALIDGAPMQIIAPPQPLALPIIELGELTETARETEALTLAREEAERPFDLNRGPLWRATLLRLKESEHILLFTMHHIISDGWSVGVLIREFAALYQAFLQQIASPLPPLPIQYADFAEWQRNWLQGDNLAAQLNYWRAQLQGSLPVLSLPFDYRAHSSTSAETPRAAYHQFQISPVIGEGLKALSRREGVTLFITLLAAFQVLLYRYCAQTDIVVGSPIAGRNRAELEPLIGFFINTLVLRVDLSGNPTFRALLTRARETVRGAFAHQELPFERLVEELQPDRDLNQTPLFQVMFVLQNIPPAQLALPGLQLSALPLANSSAKFDLTLTIGETTTGLNAVFEYHRERFAASTIAALAEHLNVLLSGIVENPNQPISMLPILTVAERDTMIGALNIDLMSTLG